MIRVLHLLGEPPDFQAERGSADLARLAPADVRITRLRIGPGMEQRNPLTAFVALRKKLDAFDVVHTWDARALFVAALAGFRKLLFSPSTPVSKSRIRKLRLAMRFREIEVVCASATHERIFLQQGIAHERCHVIRPGLDPTIVGSIPDPIRRAALGINSEEIVLLAPGESTRIAGHREALWTASILHFYDPRYRLLIWGRGDQVDSLRTLALKLRQPELLIRAEGQAGSDLPFEEIIPAADLVLATGSTAAPVLPLAACMAARKPIVASADGIAGEFLEDNRTAAMVPRRAPRLLAQRVLELVADSDLQQRIRTAAQQEAARQFASQNISEYLHLYCRMAGHTQPGAHGPNAHDVLTLSRSPSKPVAPGASS